jgi:DNA-binding MarR family transcriptional regulator
LVERLLWLGRQLSAATILFHQAVADHFGLNPTDHKCMDLLFTKGPMTAGELADVTGLTTGAITGVIDRLEGVGFARREDDPDDRRRVIVRVVPKRHEQVGRLFKHLGAATAGLSTRYNDAELVTILDFMTRSEEMLHEATLKLREERGSAGKRKRGKAGARKRRGT